MRLVLLTVVLLEIQLVTMQHGTTSQKIWVFGPVHFCGNRSCIVLRHCKCTEAYLFWTYVPNLCLQSNYVFLPHRFLHKFKKIKFDNSGIEWVLEFIYIYILLSAFGRALSYMFHICALSTFTFAIWAVVPDDDHTSNQNIYVNCNI